MHVWKVDGQLCYLSATVSTVVQCLCTLSIYGHLAITALWSRLQHMRCRCTQAIWRNVENFKRFRTGVCSVCSWNFILSLLTIVMMRPIDHSTSCPFPWVLCFSLFIKASLKHTFIGEHYSFPKKLFVIQRISPWASFSINALLVLFWRKK